MNPRTLRWQSFTIAALLTGLALLHRASLVLFVALVGLALALALNAGYAAVLDRGPRCERRRRGDRTVAIVTVVALVVPAVMAAAISLADVRLGSHVWRFTPNETEAALAAVALFFEIAFVSGLVDWYYIRPRLDGVFGTPPCRSAGTAHWKRVTRRWYLHRAIATVAFVAMIAALALTIMLMLRREFPVVADLIGGVGALMAVGLVAVRAHIQQLPAVLRFVESPRFFLGHDLTYTPEHGEPQRGFVLHVAVPVVKLVPLDDHGNQADEAFEEPNSTLAGAEHVRPGTFHGCDGGCSRINPHCVVDEAPATGRRGLLRPLVV